MKTAISVALACVALSLAACNSADDNRTTSIPSGASFGPTADIGGLSAPPAPAERGPSTWNAIARAAG